MYCVSILTKKNNHKMKYTNQDFENYSLRKSIERLEAEERINDRKAITLVLAVGLLFVVNVFLN